MLKYLSLFVSLFVFIALTAFLDKSSNPNYEPSAKKKIIIIGEVINCMYFEYRDPAGRDLLIHQYGRWGRDSIIVYHGAEIVSSFHTNGSVVTDEKYMEFDSGRLVREDQLANDKIGYYPYYMPKTYYNRYYGNIISGKTFWSNGRIKTFYRHGYRYRDSFFQSWFATGLKSEERVRDVYRFEYYEHGNLKKAQYFSKYGNDSFVQEYYWNGVASMIKDGNSVYTFSQNGILRKYSNLDEGRERMYSASGILEQVNIDTMINNHFLKCEKAYSEKGTLLSVKYFEGVDRKPVHTWTEYNRDGILVKKVQKTVLSKLPPQIGYPEDPGVMEEQVFEYVEQAPVFLGGSDAMNVYIVRWFDDLNERITRDMEGEYELYFKVMKDGSAIFTSLKGKVTKEIYSNAESMVRGMKWRPARENGRELDAGIIVRFRVKEE